MEGVIIAIIFVPLHLTGNAFKKDRFLWEIIIMAVPDISNVDSGKVMSIDVKK